MDFGALLGGAASLGGLFSSLFGGGSDTSGMEDALNRQAALQQAALDWSRKQYNTTRGDLSPYRGAGSNALFAYMDLLGLDRPDWRTMLPPGMYNPNELAAIEEYFKTGVPPSGGTFNPEEIAEARRVYDLANLPKYDPTALLESTPGYQWRVKESQNALDKYLSSKGMSLSGAGLKAAEENRQGLAASEYDKLINRISGVATMGQNSAVQTGSLGNQAVGTGVNALLTSGQQGVNSQYMLDQMRNSSYNSPWGWVGYGSGQLGNALNKFFPSGSSGNAFSNFTFPQPEFQW